MSSFSVGQMNQFANAFEAAGGTTRHLTRLGQSSNILKNLIRVLDGTMKFAIVEVAKLSLDEFFQTRSDLWVSDDFRDHVVAKVTGVPTKVDTKLFDVLLVIDTELGAVLIWKEGDLLATLKPMLTEQWGGKDGKLLNNGRANIFYTSSCVILVYWYSDGREWRVEAWKHVAYVWNVGDRAFSPAT